MNISTFERDKIPNIPQSMQRKREDGRQEEVKH